MAVGFSRMVVPGWYGDVLQRLVDGADVAFDVPALAFQSRAESHNLPDGLDVELTLEVLLRSGKVVVGEPCEVPGSGPASTWASILGNEARCCRNSLIARTIFSLSIRWRRSASSIWDCNVARTDIGRFAGVTRGCSGSKGPDRSRIPQDWPSAVLRVPQPEARFSPR